MIKILVVSDTHRHFTDVIEQQRTDPHDVMIHLGDLVDDARELERQLHMPVVYVRGNNDWQQDVPWERVLDYSGIRILVVHGHREFVGTGLDRLARSAVKNGCSAALFGHTHRRADETLQGVRLLNPGALYLPRDGIPSMLSLTLDGSTAIRTEFIQP